MPFLIAAVVLVGLLCTLDLLVSAGIIRRLRTQGEALEQLRESIRTPDSMLPVGAAIAGFTTSTVDGVPVSADTLDGQTLVGFFMPHCEGCVEQLPGFLQAAAGRPGRVLAVVLGEGAEDPEAADYATRLGPVAHVVVEAPDGPVAAAFSVTGFPAFYLVGPDRKVLASGYRLDGFPTPVGV